MLFPLVISCNPGNCVGDLGSGSCTKAQLVAQCQIPWTEKGRQKMCSEMCSEWERD